MDAAQLTIPLASLSTRAIEWIASHSPDLVATALESGIAGAIAIEAALRTDRTRAAAIVGAAAEARLEHALRRHFAHVENVSHESESADIHVHADAGLILVESKCYTGAVPTSGVEKFVRDINTCHPVAAAMVASAHITGITDTARIVHECIDGVTVPVLYIVTADVDAAAVAIAALECILRVQRGNIDIDAVGAAIDSMHAGLKALVKTANGYTDGISAAFAQMQRHLVGIGRAENIIRTALLSLEREVAAATSTTTSAVTAVTAVTTYTVAGVTFDSDIDSVRAIVSAVECAIASPQWRQSRSGIECGGVYITRTRDGNFARIPRAMICVDNVMPLLDLGAEMSAMHAKIPVTPLTVDAIAAAIVAAIGV